MKIECPSCHVSGNIDETKLPVSGKLIVCPKCGFGFNVKPPPKKWSRYMMNTCPSCGFSTFSEDTFAVCPKCGLDGEKYQKERLEKERKEAAKPNDDILIPDLPHPPLPTGSKYVNQISDESEESQPAAPPLIRWTGWGICGVGFLISFFGITGILDYAGTDWQQKIFDETGEKPSTASVFLNYGFIPLVQLAYGAFAVYSGMIFMKITENGRKLAEMSAWILMGLLIANEVKDVVRWIRLSSSRAGFSYYLAGTFGGIVMTLVWSGLIYLFIMFLKSEKMDDMFDLSV